jgi:nucleoside 2-deoxyribosyltransferase
MMRIYLAGPLFTCAEREFNSRLKYELAVLGRDVWLPQDEESPDKSAERIFADDIAAIDRSDVVVANMDGPDPDSGTCWECGYAYGRGKPYLVFRTDFRAADKPGRGLFNPMLAASASRPPIILADADVKTIANAIHSELVALEATMSKSAGGSN